VRSNLYARSLSLALLISWTAVRTSTQAATPVLLDNIRNQMYVILIFLGVFAKLRKATISFVMYVCLSPVCLSVRMEELGSHWKYFHEI
jgi:hypothetical protein